VYSVFSRKRNFNATILMSRYVNLNISLLSRLTKFYSRNKKNENNIRHTCIIVINPRSYRSNLSLFDCNLKSGSSRNIVYLMHAWSRATSANSYRIETLFFVGGLPSCLSFSVRVINLGLFHRIFLICAMKKGKRYLVVNVLLLVNVIAFVHSEPAINYDTWRISFVSGYQPL